MVFQMMMTNNLRRRSVFLTGVLVAILLSGCVSGEDAAVIRARDGIVVIAVDRGPESLDPRVGTSQASYRAHQLIFDTLVDQGHDGRLAPALAESWERLEDGDGELWILHLRKDVHFHDGSEFDAADVVATFNSMLAPDFISRKKAAFEAVEAISAVDEHTVEFRMKRRWGAFVASLPAIGILPSENVASDAAEFIGTGPFRFVERNASGGLIVRAFDDYYRGRPGVREIHIRVVPDDTTRALELMHGSVDMVINDLGILDAVGIGGWENKKIVRGAGLEYQYVGFNHRHPILSDLQVRQAIALAIDRRSIIEYLLGDLARPAASPMLPELWQADVDLEQVEFDPARARELLDEAGYPDLDGDGPEMRFRLEFKCSSLRTSRDFATVLRQQLADVGIGLDVRAAEWQTFYADVVNGNFSMYSMRWIGIIDPDFFGALFHSSSIPGLELPPDAPLRGSLNRGRYVNAEMDAMIEAAEKAPSEAGRWSGFAKVQQVMDRELPYVDLWYQDNFAVMRSDLDGLVLTLNASFRELYLLRYQQDNED